MSARYICLEGVEGVGKTTQTKKLVEYLRNKGYKVLETKEPGTPHAPLTMTLRGIMLDNQYDSQLTMASREFVSQAIRSIHLEKVIQPAMSEYDFIIQDRGVLSGLAYGTSCGNSLDMLSNLATYVANTAGIKEYSKMYNTIILLKGSVTDGIKRALASKQEFATGDAMESRGDDFLKRTSDNMSDMSRRFHNVVSISVDDKSIDEVFTEIVDAIKVQRDLHERRD